MNNTAISSERSDIMYWYCIWMLFITYKGRDQWDCESSREETPECSNIHFVSMGKHSAFDIKIFGWQYLQRTLINADVIFLYIMNRVPIWLLVSCSVGKVESRAHSVPSGSRPPYGTRTSPIILCLQWPWSIKLPHIPSSKSHDHLFYSKCSVPRPKPYVTSRNIWTFLWSSVSPSPSSQAGGPHLVVCLRLLPSTFAAILHIWRQSLLWLAHIWHLNFNYLLWKHS